MKRSLKGIFLAGAAALSFLSVSAHAGSWSENATTDSNGNQQGCNQQISEAMTDAKVAQAQNDQNLAKNMYAYLHNASYTLASCLDNLVPSMSSSGFNMKQAIADAANQAANNINSQVCSFLQSTVGQGVQEWNGAVGSATGAVNSAIGQYTNTGSSGLNLGSNTVQLTSNSGGMQSNLAQIYSNIANANGVDTSGSGGTTLGNAANLARTAAFQKTIGAIPGVSSATSTIGSLLGN